MNGPITGTRQNVFAFPDPGDSLTKGMHEINPATKYLPPRYRDGYAAARGSAGTMLGS